MIAESGAKPGSRVGARALAVMGLVAMVVIAFDQASKLMILASLNEGDAVPIVPGFFDLTLTFNHGAAFGLMAGVQDGLRHVLLALTTTLALGAVLYFLLNDYSKDSVAQVALAMIVGGAVGNIIDRFRFGAVVDFLDVYYGSYHWPAFNVADSAICVGVFVLLLRRPAKDTPSDHGA